MHSIKNPLKVDVKRTPSIVLSSFNVKTESFVPAVVKPHPRPLPRVGEKRPLPQRERGGRLISGFISIGYRHVW